MKSISLILLLAVLYSCTSNPNKPDKDIDISETIEPIGPVKKNIDSVWQNSDFDSAVAVILNGNSGIARDLKQMDTLYGKRSRRKLTELQLIAITESLSGAKSETYAPADCFVPFHGIFFYKNGEAIGRIAICFTCSSYYTLPKENGGINCQKVKQLFLDLELPAYNWDNPDEIEQSKVKYKDFIKDEK